MHDIFGMTTRMARKRLTAEQRDTPCGQRPQGNASGGEASVGKITRAAEHRECMKFCFLIVFDKVEDGNGTAQEARSLVNSGKTRNDMHNGDIKKPAPPGSLNLYLTISDRRLFDKRGTDELNDKQGKKIKEKKSELCKQLRSEQEVPGFPRF